MHTSKAASYAITASVALAMLAGCSGGSTPIGPPSLGQISRSGTQSAEGQAAQDDRSNSILALHTGIAPGRRVTTPSFMSLGANPKPLLFVSDPAASAVYIYLQAKNNKMVGQITGIKNGPAGIATDSARNLYVTNGTGVLVYAPPYTKTPKLTLNDTGYSAYNVAVSPQGIVGIANCCPPSSTSNVTFYAKSTTMPCATVSNPNFVFIYNGGFDDKGNLYILGGDSSSTFAGKITGGCNAKKIERLTTANGLSVYASSIHVYKADRIAIGDTPASSTVIYTYDPPKKGSLGNPVSTTSLTGTSYFGDFAFRASGRDVYVNTFRGSSQHGLVNEYDYPAGGMTEDTINTGTDYTYGLAVTPPLIP